MPERGASAGGRLDQRYDSTFGRGVVFGVIYEKPASGLTATFRGGLCRVGNTGNGATPSGTNGQPPVVEKAITGGTKAFTDASDTYVYVDNTGTLQYSNVATGAAKPTLATIGTDSEYLYKVVCSGGNITSVTRLWRQAAHGTFRVVNSIASYQTSEGGTNAYRIPLPAGGIVRALYGSVDIAVAATDNGTITSNLVHDGVKTAITGGAITSTASDAIGTYYEAFPTAANIAQPGDALVLDTAKTTRGGRVMVTVLVEEVPAGT